MVAQQFASTDAASKETAGRRARAKGSEHPSTGALASFVPYIGFVRDDVCFLKDGGLLVAIQYTPVERDALPDDEHLQLAARVETGLKDLDGRFAVWTRWQRRKVDVYERGDFEPRSIENFIDAEWAARFPRDVCFRDRYYLYVALYPAKRMARFVERTEEELGKGRGAIVSFATALKGSLSAKAQMQQLLDAVATQLERLDTALHPAMVGLTPLKPRRLRGDVLRGHLDALVSGDRNETALKAPTRTQPLDSYLGHAQVDTGGDQLVFSGTRTAHGKTHVSALTIKEWPGSIGPASLQSLLYLPEEFDWTQGFVCKDHTLAMKAIETMQQYFINSGKSFMQLLTEFMTKEQSRIKSNANDQLEAEAQAARDLQESLQARFGDYFNTLFVYGDDYDGCRRATQRADEAIRQGGFQTLRESVGLIVAWLGALPGNRRFLQRVGLMSSGNLVDLMQVAGAHEGPSNNPYYAKQLQIEAPPLALLPTPYGIPLRMNLHVGDNSHTLLVGKTRDGKTMMALFLLSMALKYRVRVQETQRVERPNVIIFDKDNSAKIWTHMHGGVYLEPSLDGDETSMKLAPVQMVSDPAQRGWLANFIAGLLCSRAGDTPLSSSDMREIDAALTRVAASPPEARNMTGVRLQLPMHLRGRLERWCMGGTLGGWFDNTEDGFELTSLTTVELGRVLKDPDLASPVLQCMLVKVELLAQQRDRPTFIYIPELWYALQLPQFRDFIRDWLKTMAKLLGTVIMDTQSLEDTSQEDAKIFTTLRDNVATILFTPNRRARAIAGLYKEQFGLTETQIAMLESGISQRNYFVLQDGGLRVVDVLLPKAIVHPLRSDRLGRATFDSVYEPSDPSREWSVRYMEAMMECDP